MPVSSDNYLSIQRKLLNLYERGHIMTPEQLDRAIDGLIGNTLQMVKHRRLETAAARDIIKKEEGPNTV